MHFTIDEKGNIGNSNCTPEQVEFCLKALNDHGITIDDIKEQYKKGWVTEDGYELDELSWISGSDHFWTSLVNTDEDEKMLFCIICNE